MHNNVTFNSTQDHITALETMYLLILDYFLSTTRKDTRCYGELIFLKF